MRRIARNSAANIAANATASAAQWLIIIVFSHAYGNEALGAYGLILAIVSPLFLIGGLNLRTFASSLPDSAYHPRCLLRMQATGITLAATASLLIAWLTPALHQVYALVLAVIAGKIVESSAEGRYGFLQRTGDASRIAVRKCCRALFSFAIFVTLAHLLGLSPAVALGGVFAASLAVFLIAEMHIGRQDMPPAGDHPLQPLLRPALISGAASAIDALIIALPRFALGSAEDLTAVGIFTVLVQLPMIGAVIVSGIGQAAISPLRLAQTRHAYLAMVAKAHLAVAALGLAGIGLAMTSGDMLMQRLYGPELAGTGALLTPIMAGGLAWYLASINGVALQARARYGLQLAATCSAVMAAAITIALLPPGIHTAVLAYVAAMTTRLAVSAAALAATLLRA